MIILKATKNQGFTISLEDTFLKKTTVRGEGEAAGSNWIPPSPAYRLTVNRWRLWRKEAKGTKMCAIKRKRKFENYKNCLEANQLENKINYLEKNETNINSLRKGHREFIKYQ